MGNSTKARPDSRGWQNRGFFIIHYQIAKAIRSRSRVVRIGTPCWRPKSASIHAVFQKAGWGKVRFDRNDAVHEIGLIDTGTGALLNHWNGQDPTFG